MYIPGGHPEFGSVDSLRDIHLPPDRSFRLTGIHEQRTVREYRRLADIKTTSRAFKDELRLRPLNVLIETILIAWGARSEGMKCRDSEAALRSPKWFARDVGLCSG